MAASDDVVLGRTLCLGASFRHAGSYLVPGALCVTDMSDAFLRRRSGLAPDIKEFSSFDFDQLYAIESRATIYFDKFAACIFGKSVTGISQLVEPLFENPE